MKKIFFILTLIIFVSASHAQFIRGYGLKAGTTIANQNWEFSGIPGADFDNRVGLNIGIFAEFLNVPFISIVAEVNYLQKGMKEDVPVTTMTQPDGTGEFITLDTRVDYINISALGKLRINTGLFTPYILLGPKLDFEINNRTTIGSHFSYKENFKKNIFGLKVGAGTEINLLPVGLLVEFVYDADYNAVYETPYLKVNSKSYDLRIGIMF